MKLMILGGSNVQLNAVKRAKEKGHTVVVCDYYEDAPAKKLADYSELASTFDVEACIEAAKRHAADGVMTLGTDQPVYTAARVAAECGLPSLITVETARAATNKKVMKGIFKNNCIPSVNYRIIGLDFCDSELEDMSFPVVVKPLDSQGQRGVYKLDSIEAVRTVFSDILSFSREKEILAEEYYPSDEITVSGWVHGSMLHLLTVTDRICYNNYPHIGICTAHNFPSRFLPEYHDEITRLSERIVQAFSIHEGPVYFQMLMGDRGIMVNEIACRIGGAYEDLFIPLVTGIDILDILIEASLGDSCAAAALEQYRQSEHNRPLTVQLLFASPCTIRSMNDMESLKRLPGVVEAGYNFKPGHSVRSIENATARAGFVIVTGENHADLRENVGRIYDCLEISDETGVNRILNSY
ncbi:MAG TPA: ATP-grasp domain-containing protein [Clostridia bacterium]|nr:ATP-grasp domain-containing protein [Clostridia bacterium]